jgi:hypothetical protein
MPAAFIGVLKDLWAFVITKPVVSNPPKSVLLLPEASPPATQTPETSPPLKASFSLESRVGYVTQPKVRCLQVPQKKFDTLRGLFKYGEAVKVIQQKDQWSFVESAAIQGWVESIYLTEDKKAVFPQLHSGQTYDANNLETKKLRQYLNDELLGGLLELPLQPTEFVTYQLRRLAIEIAWPLERPRLPGMWQAILAGKRGVSIGPEPKTGSVLESTSGPKQFLAFVESVTPDDSLVISGVGRQQEGGYEQTECTRAQWLEWKPVFISFT